MTTASSSHTPFGYDDDDGPVLAMDVDPNAAVPTGGAPAPNPAAVRPKWYPTPYPTLDECKHHDASGHRRRYPCLQPMVKQAPRANTFWNAPEERDTPFLRCPHFFSSRTQPGIEYGCAAHASTPTDAMLLFSPVDDMALQPAPVPHGPPHEQIKMRKAIDEEWKGFWVWFFNLPEKKRVLDKHAGRCRTCLRRIPAHQMWWPLPTARQTDVFTSRGIWEGGRFDRPDDVVKPCVAVKELEYNLETKFYGGCCNFHAKHSKFVQGEKVTKGFAQGTDCDVTCNLCGASQGQNGFVDEEHVQQSFVDDDDDNVFDPMQQSEQVKHAAENFFHAIGIDPPLMDSVAKKAWKCDACPRYNHECEACWKCHPCTCPGKDRRPLTVEQAIVRIMDSLWTQYDDERKGAGAVKEIFRTYHDAHEKGKAIVNTVRKKTVLGNINRNVACAIRLVLEKYAPVIRKNLDEDRVNETPDEEDIRTLGDRVWKVMRESIFTFHDCACNAHREAFRVQQEREHAPQAEWAAAVRVARGRWEECMLWFHLLWGRKSSGEECHEGYEPSSPYLEAPDAEMYREILSSALKDPLRYYKYHHMRASPEVTRHVGNSMQWSILIAMMVQFRKSAVRLQGTEKPRRSRKDPPPTPVDMDCANRQIGPKVDVAVWADAAAWGVLTEFEKERWTYEDMVQYAAANKKLYYDARETDHAKATGGERQAGGLEDDRDSRREMQATQKLVDHYMGYRNSERHTLVCWVPKFLQHQRLQMMEVGADGVQYAEGYENLSEEDKATARDRAVRIHGVLQAEIRDHMYMVSTLDELLALNEPAGRRKDFWKGRVPATLFQLFVRGKGKTFKFQDLCDERGFLTLTGKLAKAAAADRDERECAILDDRWKAWMDKNAVGFECESVLKLDEHMFSSHERANHWRARVKARKARVAKARAAKAAEAAAAKAEHEAAAEPARRQREESREAAAVAGPKRKKFKSANPHLQKKQGETSAAASRANEQAAVQRMEV